MRTNKGTCEIISIKGRVVDYSISLIIRQRNKDNENDMNECRKEFF